MQVITTFETAQLVSLFTTPSAKHQHLRTMSASKSFSVSAASRVLIKGTAKVSFTCPSGPVSLSTTGVLFLESHMTDLTVEASSTTFVFIWD